MAKTYISVSELAGAFPNELRNDVLDALSSFPAVRILGEPFSVLICTERVVIPGRLHFDPTLIQIDSLSPLQREIVDCLLTRHSDGFVRQKHLAHIAALSHAWIPPFVVRLTGEHVFEILNVIYERLPALDRHVYTEFLRNNPGFLDLMGQRIASYWNCYYRNKRPEEYVGFKILEFFRALEPAASSGASFDGV